MRRREELPEDEITVLLFGYADILAMRSYEIYWRRYMKNMIFVFNRGQYENLRSNTYAPNNQYIFLDTSYTDIHGAGAFIQNRFCNFTNSHYPTGQFSPGIIFNKRYRHSE